ncbi:MAG: hypothetical protein AB1714_30795 [Acidobacteriota bacterium]
MKTSLAVLGIAALALVLPLPASAGGSADALSLVPADAATVGMVRIAEMRANPLCAQFISETDRIASGGEADSFLRDAGLKPADDVDLLVVALAPLAGKKQEVRALIAAEGRFDAGRLAAALEARGALKQTAPGGTYYRLPEKDTHCKVEGKDVRGAVAFVESRLLVAGTEDAVLQALADHARGSSGFRSGVGLGRQLERVDVNSTAWALVDAKQLAQDHRFGTRDTASSADSPAAGLAAAFKPVSCFAASVTFRGEELDFSATGVSTDEEALKLLEDTLRGVLAFWRLAVQEKNPDMVSAIRAFEVDRDDDSVTLAGTIPGDMIRRLIEKPAK